MITRDDGEVGTEGRLVGRESELNTLAELVEDAEAGHVGGQPRNQHAGALAHFDRADYDRRPGLDVHRPDAHPVERAPHEHCRANDEC